MGKLIPKKPQVICLCGSTKFIDHYDKANETFSLQGCIVLTIHERKRDQVPHESKQKTMLDELHLRKIDMADIVYILNVGGYIGPSTQSEINYATQKGKLIMYLEPVD